VIDTGHADEAALLAASQLEDLLRQQLDLSALVDLAQLSIEPLHREDDAALFVSYALRLHPGHPRASIIYGYLALHYWIADEWLHRADGILQSLVDRGLELGAAPVLLDEVRRQTGSDAPDANIDLLRLSVSAEPTWSINHLRLARALRAQGDHVAARMEFDLAIGNLLEGGHNIDPVSESFHDCFTGCFASRERLIAERDQG
jgi:hypothetical protein